MNNSTSNSGTSASPKRKISVLVITTIGVLIALDIVLSRLVSIQTPITRITVNFIARAVCGFIFGPIWSMLSAGIADALGAFLLSPYPFFIGYTITAVFLGAMYGVFLHKKITIPRILLVTLVNTVVGTLLLNTLWVTVQQCDASFMSADFIDYYKTYLITRLPQAGINSALQIVIMIATMHPLSLLKSRFYPAWIPGAKAATIKKEA